jgi:hypothetical protein
MAVLNLNDTILLLLGKREPRFPYEREIGLFQFQTWIYSPGFRKDQRAAKFLASAKFRRHIQEQKFGTRSLRVKILMQLLRDPDYKNLYNRIRMPLRK